MKTAFSEMKNEDEWLDGSRTARFSLAFPWRKGMTKVSLFFGQTKGNYKFLRDLTLRRTWQEGRTARKKRKRKDLHCRLHE
jgi:hypothetical protein